MTLSTIRDTNSRRLTDLDCRDQNQPADTQYLSPQLIYYTTLLFSFEIYVSVQITQHEMKTQSKDSSITTVITKLHPHRVITVKTEQLKMTSKNSNSTLTLLVRWQYRPVNSSATTVFMDENESMVAACCLQVRNTHCHRRDALLKPDGKEAHTTITVFLTHYGSKVAGTMSSFSALIHWLTL